MTWNKKSVVFLNLFTFFLRFHPFPLLFSSLPPLFGQVGYASVAAAAHTLADFHFIFSVFGFHHVSCRRFFMFYLSHNEQNTKFNSEYGFTSSHIMSPWIWSNAFVAQPSYSRSWLRLAGWLAVRCGMHGGSAMPSLVAKVGPCRTDEKKVKIRRKVE